MILQQIIIAGYIHYLGISLKNSIAASAAAFISILVWAAEMKFNSNCEGER